MIDQKEYASDVPTLHGKTTMTKSEFKEQLNLGNDKAEKLLNECSVLGAVKIGGNWVIPVAGFVKMLQAIHELPNHQIILKFYGPRKAPEAKESIKKFLEIMGEDMNNFDIEGIIKKYEGIV